MYSQHNNNLKKCGKTSATSQDTAIETRVSLLPETTNSGQI
jgi:hypothetical protein